MTSFVVWILRSATSCVTAVMLTASGAMAQMAGAPGQEEKDKCKFFKVEIGQSAEIRPHEEVKVEDLEGFLYFLQGDSRLREDFRLRRGIRDSCAAFFPAFQQAASQAAVGTSAAAATAGVAPTTLAAGSIAGTLGIIGITTGIVVVGVVGAVALSSNDSNTSAVNSNDVPTIGPE